MLPDEETAAKGWETREETETDWDYGQRPENRSLEKRLENGLILVDKPNGPTSNQIDIWMKKLLNRGKTGHSGTLDPHVTGVLPIGLNQGTKVLNPLSQADKEYVCVMETEDQVAYMDAKNAADELVGTVTQMPPEKSAVKREEREREIYDIDVLEVSEKQVLFRIQCEKGFYVRTFCEQFGNALGTDGEMGDLRRTQVGVFTEDETYTLQSIADEHAFWQSGDEHTLDDIVLPIEAGVRHIPKIVVKDSAVGALTHGANLGAGGINKLQKDISKGDTVAILTQKGELVATAIATTDTETMLETDEEAAELDRVFMTNDVYPKEW